MTTVAVSYRRSDSAAIAGRISDHLMAHYSTAAVFLDVDKIPYGKDFRTHIKEVLEQTDVLVAVIGANWLGHNADSTSRMQKDDDPVRVEIETAVERKKNGKMKIMPVLIDGAKMPDADVMPKSFEDFAYLNAPEVSSGRDFRRDMGRLIEAIDELMNPSEASGSRPGQPYGFAGAGLLSADAIEAPPAPHWRDYVVRYFLPPFIVLLVAHYLFVNSLDLNINYLRVTLILVPAAAGFALFWNDGGRAAAATALATALGLAGTVCMTVSQSLYSGDPIMPRSPFEWRDNFQFAATIALSFIAGHLVARALSASMRRRPAKI
jgi:hypothetical protein